ncbi:hypothetical protein BVRB_002440 [Beta vulgaris subsp. vulgaris]|uniref:Uncharacterized protein n=1 Tax=Beta vulgaris subsp. vulgaris TaxID=3555 RepID=A0A0J8DYZ4_BETVV|nr:hypothetical protein BVRB_002440 [Beta vulgaris subsp. vulgaris]
MTHKATLPQTPHLAVGHPYSWARASEVSFTTAQSYKLLSSRKEA